VIEDVDNLISSKYRGNSAGISAEFTTNKKNDPNVAYKHNIRTQHVLKIRVLHEMNTINT